MLPPSQESPNKSYIATTLFSFFLGWLAIDRFYLGKFGTAQLKLLTIGGLGISAMIDFFLILFGETKDRQGLCLKGYAKHHKSMQIIMVSSIVTLTLLSPFILVGIASLVQNHVRSSANVVSDEADQATLSSALTAYYFTNNSMPSATQFYDGTFTLPKLGVRSPHDITYYAYPKGCDGKAIPCTSYYLTIKFIDGNTMSEGGA